MYLIRTFINYPFYKRSLYNEFKENLERCFWVTNLLSHFWFCLFHFWFFDFQQKLEYVSLHLFCTICEIWLLYIFVLEEWRSKNSTNILVYGHKCTDWLTDLPETIFWTQENFKYANLKKRKVSEHNNSIAYFSQGMEVEIFTVIAFKQFIQMLNLEYLLNRS